jgi:hypothetical protein
MADTSLYPDANSDTGVRPDRGSPPSTPRWVKVFVIIALVLVLLFVVLMFTGIGGEHGPGRHMPSGDAGGDTPPSSFIEDSISFGGGLGGDTSSDGPDDPTLPIEDRVQQA